MDVWRSLQCWVLLPHCTTGFKSSQKVEDHLHNTGHVFPVGHYCNIGGPSFMWKYWWILPPSVLCSTFQSEGRKLHIQFQFEFALPLWPKLWWPQLYDLVLLGNQEQWQQPMLSWGLHWPQDQQLLGMCPTLAQGLFVWLLLTSEISII